MESPSLDFAKSREDLEKGDFPSNRINNITAKTDCSLQCLLNLWILEISLSGCSGWQGLNLNSVLLH